MSKLIAKASPDSTKVVLFGKIYKSGYLGSKSNSDKPHVIHFDKVKRLSKESCFVHFMRQVITSTFKKETFKHEST